MKRRESRQQLKERVSRVLKLLRLTYPHSHCSLIFKTPFQLLCATVLSAQCTDERVNQVTPRLFERYPNAEAMAKAPLSSLEALVRSTGFYKNKALALKNLSQALVEGHEGQVPKDLESLTRLRGVGRKTANVVLGNAFGIPGMVVDTHVGRISRRLGFTSHSDPVKVEQDLMALVPVEEWVIYSHWLIDHGRAICSARTQPRCAQCELVHECPRVGVQGAKGV